MSNNPPEVTIEVSRELADFILTNCDTNIGFGLAALQGVEDRNAAEKMVALLENFKSLKAATERALK